MCEYDYLGTLKRNIKTKLKTEIKGSVKVYSLNDAIIIEVYAVNNIIWKVIIEDISMLIKDGETSKSIARKALYDYTNYIKFLFFNKN